MNFPFLSFGLQVVVPQVQMNQQGGKIIKVIMEQHNCRALI
jgi:hypothetical protein